MKKIIFIKSILKHCFSHKSVNKPHPHVAPLFPPVPVYPPSPSSVPSSAWLGGDRGDPRVARGAVTAAGGDMIAL